MIERMALDFYPRRTQSQLPLREIRQLSATSQHVRRNKIYTSFRFYDAISDFSRTYAQMIDALICRSREI